MKIIKREIPNWNIKNKCPIITEKSTITIHNTGNTATAVNEADYMRKNTNKVSFHAVVDENEVVECIPWNRNAYHCANRTGNNTSYSIEIARSTSENEALFIQAEKNAIKYIASLLNKHSWNTDKLRTHKNWNGKNCPHKTLKLGWQRFINEVDKELKALKGNTQPPKDLIKVIASGTVYELNGKIWRNGSTPEQVFETPKLIKPIGLIFPNERAVCRGKTAGAYLVEYVVDTPKGKSFKTGYVRYNGQL